MDSLQGAEGHHRRAPYLNQRLGSNSGPNSVFNSGLNAGFNSGLNSGSRNTGSTFFPRLLSTLLDYSGLPGREYTGTSGRTARSASAYEQDQVLSSEGVPLTAQESTGSALFPRSSSSLWPALSFSPESFRLFSGSSSGSQRNSTSGNDPTSGVPEANQNPDNLSYLSRSMSAPHQGEASEEAELLRVETGGSVAERDDAALSNGSGVSGLLRLESAPTPSVAAASAPLGGMSDLNRHHSFVPRGGAGEHHVLDVRSPRAAGAMAERERRLQQQQQQHQVLGAAEVHRGHSHHSHSTSGMSGMQQHQQQHQHSGSGQQRYDLTHAARWLEQGVPFFLLLFIVFIRQHLAGFATFLWLTVILVRSNDFIKKQAALKGDRKLLHVWAMGVLLIAHVAALQYIFSGQMLLRPLLLLPLNQSPPFWNALFIVFVNDHLVRFAGMAVKCAVLSTCCALKNRSFRRQAQILTLVEYTLLLYRALIPAPVWYRFFLNDKLGHLFSSLITGLYLTFKLSFIIDRFILFLTSLRQVVRKEAQYGSQSTPEEILKAGEMCSICHEKMLSPITLKCCHVFCEGCVSEWFEREQTCPLCRTIVRAPSLKSYGDASTTLTMQLF